MTSNETQVAEIPEVGAVVTYISSRGYEKFALVTAVATEEVTVEDDNSDDGDYFEPCDCGCSDEEDEDTTEVGHPALADIVNFYAGTPTNPAVNVRSLVAVIEPAKKAVTKATLTLRVYSATGKIYLVDALQAAIPSNGKIVWKAI